MKRTDKKEELISFNDRVVQSQKKLELIDEDIDLIGQKVDVDFGIEKSMIEEYIDFEENIDHHKKQIEQGYVC